MPSPSDGVSPSFSIPLRCLGYHIIQKQKHQRKREAAQNKLRKAVGKVGETAEKKSEDD